MDPTTHIAPPPLPEVWAVPPSGRVLVAAPHPDDEVCGVGGALALHRLQGDEAWVLFLTDGDGGDPESRLGDVGRTRRCEASEAASRLGGLELRFWGLPDNFEVTEGDLAEVGSRLARLLEDLRPQVLYCPWVGESHRDHRNTRLALDRALAAVPQAPAWILEYEVWSPLPADAILDITDVVAIKRNAIRAHSSQIAYTDYVHHILGLNAHRAVYLPHGRTHGEAFRVAARPRT